MKPKYLSACESYGRPQRIGLLNFLGVAFWEIPLGDFSRTRSGLSQPVTSFFPPLLIASLATKWLRVRVLKLRDHLKDTRFLTLSENIPLGFDLVLKRAQWGKNALFAPISSRELQNQFDLVGNLPIRPASSA